MFMETPDTLLYVAAGAFLLGWLVGKFAAFLGSKIQARQRDPRDDRIRNLDAELRIAQADIEKKALVVDGLQSAAKDVDERMRDRDTVLQEQKDRIAKLKSDLRDSVKKTRELRAELSDRATENVRSEVKLREVETELSVAQASTDMIATGVLDYSLDNEEDELPGESANTA